MLIYVDLKNYVFIPVVVYPIWTLEPCLYLLINIYLLPGHNLQIGNDCFQIQYSLSLIGTRIREYRLRNTRFNSSSLYKCMQVTPVNTNPG